MAAGVLHDVSLGYQLLWDTRRDLAGVQLWVDTHENQRFDPAHLLSTLGDLWHPTCRPLMLSTRSASLLADLLDLTPPALASINVLDVLLQDPAVAQRVLRAHQRGLQLVWQGEPGTQPKAAFVGCFSKCVLCLSAEEALMGLRISLRSHNGSPLRPGATSPVRAGQVYEGVASRVLAEHCLDEQGAAALLGWPTEDVLHGYRHKRIQPGQDTIAQLLQALRTDAPMDEVERRLGEDPTLAYRFLRYTNSAGLGLNREITALRQGLMVLGLGRVKSWLQEQLAHACRDPNLQPVRTTLVLRAQFMAELLQAGEGEALKRELYLCGLLSQIDLLLGEPLTSALHVIPLPERVSAAILGHSGAYWPYLDIATALETPDTAVTRAICEAHGFDAEDVNLALLRTLAALRRPAD